MDDQQLFAIVARKVPLIWNAAGPASLNPQPLPPIEAVDPLNPQPLPPGPPPELYGVAVAQELLRVSYQARLLGPASTAEAAATWAADAVPTAPAVPVIPPQLPPVHEPNQAWLEGYYLGLACTLALRSGAGTTYQDDQVDALFRQAVAALRAIGEPTEPPTVGA